MIWTFVAVAGIGAVAMFIGLALLGLRLERRAAARRMDAGGPAPTAGDVEYLTWLERQW